MPASPIRTAMVLSTFPSRGWLQPPTTAVANMAPRPVPKARWTGTWKSRISRPVISPAPPNPMNPRWMPRTIITETMERSSKGLLRVENGWGRPFGESIGAPRGCQPVRYGRGTCKGVPYHLTEGVSQSHVSHTTQRVISAPRDSPWSAHLLRPGRGAVVPGRRRRPGGQVRAPLAVPDIGGPDRGVQQARQDIDPGRPTPQGRHRRRLPRGRGGRRREMDGDSRRLPALGGPRGAARALDRGGSGPQRVRLLQALHCQRCPEDGSGGGPAAGHRRLPRAGGRQGLVVVYH